MILVGRDNEVNERINLEVSRIVNTEFLEIDHFLGNSFKLHPKKDSEFVSSEESILILINLMDVGKEEQLLIDKLRQNWPDSILVGLHVHRSEYAVMPFKKKDLDDYISIFDFTNEFLKLLKSHKITS